ncbi:MAG: HAD family phosphatase, partial [Acidobacteriota bacterium]
KAILMDFNGVIIDDEALQMKAYRDVFAVDSVELSDEDYYASLGMDDRTFVAAQFARKGKSVTDDRISAIIEEKSGKWREMVSERLPLFEGIENFIEKMSREFVLGLVSMARRHEIDHVLDRSGLGRFFQTIVSADDVTNSKPDPECFRLGFKRLDAIRTAMGHTPMVHGDCLVIEDSPAGIQAAKAADLHALGVSNSVDAAALRAAGAGAIATDLRDWMPDSIRLLFV